MRIEYKILWLDDHIDVFIEDEHIKEVENYLQEEGFLPIVDPVQNSKEFFTKLDNSYDLILTDYHMKDEYGNGLNGDEVVEIVRKKQSVLTEILFYTAKADLKDTQKLDRISFFETQSSASDHEEAVVERTKNLISLTIRKFHDIVVMRGLIMQETSELDNQQLEILRNFIDNKTADETKELKIDILTKIDSHYTSKLSLVNGDWKVKANGFKSLMKDKFVFSSDYKMETLSKILKELNYEDFSSTYKKEITSVRNKFAHAKLEEEKDENGKVIRKYFKHGVAGITFDADYCKIIRTNIIKHKQNLEKLKSEI